MSIRTQRSSARFGAATVVAALLASLFAFASPAGAVQNVTQERVSGIDRYATAAEVAEEAFPGGAANVILASGENYPDGLAASGLAGFASAPVLLTTTDGLPAVTASALADLNATTVHVVGGTAAISQSVRDQVESLGYTLNELSGPNRYATAAAIAEYAATVAPIGTFAGGQAAIVATGENYADALSAGSPAYNNRLPILLTPTNSLAPSTSAALDDLGVTEVIVMGGTAAVSAATVTAIEGLGIDVTRVSGADRYATATALGELLLTDVADGGFGYDGVDVVLASGQNFADALAAGPWAGSIQAPLVLTEQCDLPAVTSTFLTEHNDTIAYIGAAGGTAAICDAAFDAADAAATTATPTANIMANEGASTFTVVFSEPVAEASVDNSDFEVNNVDLAAGAPTVVDSTATAGGNVATTFVVPAGGPLDVGDIIDLEAGQINTLDGRVNVFTRVTVAADNTAPTATINAIEGRSEAYVTFSEPVVEAEAEAAANYAVNSTTGGTGITGPAVYDAATQTATVPLDAALASGDVFRLLSGQVNDLAGNAAPATAATVFPDNAAPTVASAELTVDNTVAQANVMLVGAAAANDLLVEAKPAGPAAGVNGNLWAVTVDDTATSLSVSVNTTTRRVSISYDSGNLPTNSEVQTALVAAGATFNDRFATAVQTIGDFDVAAGTYALTGGASDALIDVQFSEGVENVQNTDFQLDADGDGFGLVAADAVDSAIAFDGLVQVTFNLTGTTQAPVPGTSELYVSDVDDLSGNTIANTIVTITAAD